MLLVLLVAVMAFVLWFVRGRRAELRNRPAGEKVVGPLPATPSPPAPASTPLDLAQHEAKTIDFSSGQPVVKDSATDRAALDQGLKDIEEATRGVTFEAAKKEAPKKP